MYMVLTAKLITTNDIENMLNKKFNMYCHIYNVCVKHAIKHIKMLENDTEYIKLQQIYKQNKILTKTQWARRAKLIKKYHLSEHEFQSYLVKCKNNNHNANIDIVQKLATTCWQATENYLFSNGKSIHFRKRNNFTSFEGKKANSAILFKNDEISFLGHKIKYFVRNKDEHLKSNLENKVKYCRMLRKWHKTKWRYYVQFVVAGTPKTQQHDEGTVGIDVGPSTIAVVSDSTVKIEEIAQNVNKVDNEIADLNRQIDVLKRRNNPNNYNEDKTIKKGHHKWIKTSEQIKLETKRRWLYQKRHNLLDYHHNCYAKNLLKLGNVFIVEDMQFAKMAENINCGKSIANHAPSKLLNLLKWKARDCIFVKVDCFKTCATQFDHTTGEYVKHDLDERVIKLGNGDTLQRDIHSAFNLKHIIISDGFYQYDIDKMNKDYKSFKQKHDEVINKILQDKLEGKRVLKSIL